MASCRRLCTRLCLTCSSHKCLRFLLILLLVTAASIYYNLFFILTTNRLEDGDFVGVDKCPACYGTSMCHEFSHGHLSLSSYSRFLNIVNVKNVYFALHNEKNVDLVLKRLAHDSELSTFDADICKNAGAVRDCDVAKGIFQTKFARVLEAASLDVGHVEGLSDVVRCPSNRLLERILTMYTAHIPGKTLSKEHKLMLMTMLSVNPEPIIYMIFPNSEGWPFPQYYGACGRLIVEEYVGQNLGSYFNSEWSKRLDLAYQVMKIAEQMTNNELEYGVYMTDVTFDNYAVDRDGRVFIIDAENIIVVDKRKIKTDAKPSWNERHQSFHHECKSHPGCLSFSSELLCKRHSSDHNYYATCHGLLAKNSGWAGTKGGLLHDPPADLPEREQLNTLIDECEKPSQQNGRYDAMKQLLQLLSDLSDGS